MHNVINMHVFVNSIENLSILFLILILVFVIMYVCMLMLFLCVSV